MKLKDFLKEFEGLDPELEVYSGCLSQTSWISEFKKFQIQRKYVSDMTPNFALDFPIANCDKEIIIIDFQYK